MKMRFFLFGMLGAVSFAVNLGVTALLHEVLGWPERTSFGTALAVVYLMNFAACRWGVFAGSERPLPSQLLMFLGTSAGFRFLEFLVFSLLFARLSIPYLAAAALSLAASFLVKFYTYDRLVFVRKGAATPGTP